MPIWLVTAIWSDDDGEQTQRWEVTAPTRDEAARDVLLLVPIRPHHVEAKCLSEDVAPDLGPGQARTLD